ncbi:MAG TPA: SDR family NAD(P)-dependent oxidoreductase [Verrucomicrobiales bacterium]|jgi:3-oxoacyl-[acyl-carrier protein] reductase|nr:SDR family NAD(P)-dependent oxidoreductase [Verrucomicrobiales bacterium]
MKTTDQKVAAITGSSRGIGAEIALRLARDGFHVVVNYASGAGPAQEVVSKIEAAGGKAIALQADVADPAAVTAMFDAAEKTFGGVDVVVNCAGILKLAKIADTGDQAFDQLIAINLKGTFLPCREAARRLRDGGRIINFSSSTVGLRLPAYGAYIATKAAVEGLTQVLAQEMRGRSRNRRFRTLLYGVNPNTGAAGSVLTRNVYYDAGSNVIRDAPSGSQALP